MRQKFPTSDEGTGGAAVPQTAACPDVVEAVEAARTTCPAPATSTDRDQFSNPWASLWYEGLRDQALPAVIADETITPAASLWTGARLWSRAFRAANLRSGDRLVIAVPPSATFVQILVAAIWEGYTIALVSPSANVPALLETLDARAAVTDRKHPHVWRPEGFAGPRTTPDALRSANEPSYPNVRFLLRTSGTTGQARWVALSDRNVLSVLASHLPHARLGNARVISVLPWWHAFGLVLDLLPALLSGAEIIRDPEGGRSPRSILALSRAWGATHLNAVPLTVQRLLDRSDGRSFLKQLRGGIVGGAPISAPLAEALQDTHLRVGYGQTEASPGIMLGEPGAWHANYLGHPVGCDVAVSDAGELLFEGPNACVGFWQDGHFHPADPHRTVATGDRVRRTEDGFFFEGRTDTAFKLSNGRLVPAGTWEARLKSRFPALHDALLYTPNGTDLHLAICAQPDAAPDEETLRTALDGLGRRVDCIEPFPPDAWMQSPKGDVDRAAMVDRLSA